MNSNQLSLAEPRLTHHLLMDKRQVRLDHWRFRAKMMIYSILTDFIDAERYIDELLTKKQF